MSHITEDGRQRLREFHTGRTHTEATKEKLRLANAGKTLSPEHREKLRQAGMGRVFSEESKDKIRQKLLGNQHNVGRKHSPEAIEKMKLKAKDRKPISDETREKIRKTLTGRVVPLKVRLKLKGQFAGEKSRFWKGGVAKINKSERQLAMETIEYKYWRQSVFIRDDYTCQECSERGGKLNADHIKSWAEYPELRYDLNNGRTLCEKCHRKTDSYGNRNKPYGLEAKARREKNAGP